MANKEEGGKEAWYTLSGDVNNDMVRRVFNAGADMRGRHVDVAHVLLQSHGGYVSDGLCLHHYLANLGVDIRFYNAGAVVSIAVPLFLSGRYRVAAPTARFMIHRSHASPPEGAGAEELRIIADGLLADDRRTETILRAKLTLTPRQWKIHLHEDLHLDAEAALKAGLVHEIGAFAPPPGARLVNM